MLDLPPSGCSVVVDPTCTKRVENGLIYVPSLQDGFQICKNGGKLWLRNGDYAAETYFDINHVRGKKPLEIIGESCSDCCITGSIRIMSSSAGITFREDVKKITKRLQTAGYPASRIFHATL